MTSHNNFALNKQNLFMEDSFFGFDTSMPLDDGGRIAEPSEEEYDALNDETFGSAINADWEEVHENLVRLKNDVVTSDRSELVSSCAYNSKSGIKYRFQNLANSDLELNFSNMKMDDLGLDCADNESNILDDTIKMDPSVWASGSSDKSVGECTNNIKVKGNCLPSDPEEFLREHFPQPFQRQLDYDRNGHQQLQSKQLPNVTFGLRQVREVPLQPQITKICTLEDVERNIMQSISKQTSIRQQQQVQKQQQDFEIIAKQRKTLNDCLKHPSETSNVHQTQHLKQQTLSPQYSLLLGQQGSPSPEGFCNPNQQLPPRPTNNFGSNLYQHSLGSLGKQHLDRTQPCPLHTQSILGSAGIRLPPACFFQQQFSPLLNQHRGLQSNFHNQHPLPNAHLPVALNNFAMHPNFNAMRATGCNIHSTTMLAQKQLAVQPRIPGQPSNSMNQNFSHSSFDVFNKRLVQEIQQNHPLLQNAVRQAQQHQQQNIVDRKYNINNSNMQRNGSGPNASTGATVPTVGNQRQNHNMRRDVVSTIGNLPHEDFDEYANLMSTREKHWLIGIQLSQLNTDTPYIDDYYYTIYKERKRTVSGNLRHSQAHTDNQLNHPLTQPKGHAQLILVQLGNKNGQRNGQYRERHNSENQNQSQDLKFPTYVFTPFKFENSLGKLQYGSVNAPRKIIDAEIMSNEATSTTCVDTKDGSCQLGCSTAIGGDYDFNMYVGTNPGTLHFPGIVGEMSSAHNQRKSRYILLHIEMLYRILLKLEDLNNPSVIATVLMKKKKERERIAALEQLENANKASEELTPHSSNTPTMKSKFNYDIETKDTLVEKIVAGLQHDQVVSMMSVRKGKVLIRRIMPNIENMDIRWNVWIGVFNSLQNILKRDRDDTECVLDALYPEFAKQIKSATFEILVNISSAITLNEKKPNGVFNSKFVISSLVCLILQAENIYEANADTTLTENNKYSWRLFLDHVTSSLNRTIQNQTICAAIESDSIQPIINHFARFKDLKLDSLLALITEAKQQVN